VEKVGRPIQRGGKKNGCPKAGGRSECRLKKIARLGRGRDAKTYRAKKK